MTQEPQIYKYFAFISYKSDDVKWAAWLQRKLEQYTLPAVLQHKNSNLPHHLKPIFRDGSDIGLGELKPELHNNLLQSRFLIVVCSPRSATSSWVGSEIEQFCQMGRRDRIIAFIIDGKPYSDDPTTECYHPILKQMFPRGGTTDTDMQLLGADIHSATSIHRRLRKEYAFIQVVSAMLRLPVDDLWNRRRRFIKNRIIASIATCILLLAGFLTLWQVSKPFDLVIHLDEVTAFNPKLPQEEGKIAMIADGKTLNSKTLVDSCHTMTFPEVPSKYRGTIVRVIFSEYGYHPVDTLFTLGNTHHINIRRDDTFAVYSGIIQDDSECPLSGVDISIATHHTTTDSDGRFFLKLPVEEQLPIQKVTFMKSGYLPAIIDLQPQTDHSIMMFKKNQ